jgi:hypothetical protein
LDKSIEEIIKEQYYLATKGISPLESSLIPDFEREAFVNLYLKDMSNDSSPLS